MATESLRDLLIDLQLEIDNSPIRQIRDINRQLDSVTRQARQFDRSFDRAMGSMPEHLRPAARSFHDLDLEMRSLARNGTRSLEDMQQTVMRTRVGFDKMTSATSSGKQAARYIQEISESAKEAQLAVLGFDKTASRMLSPQETTAKVAEFRQELDSTRKKLEELRDAGDFGSYEAGMRALSQRTREFQRAIIGAARGGREYMDVMRKLGIVTSNDANAQAVFLELQRDSFFRSHQMLQEMATQSEKISENLSNLDPFYSLSAGALEFTDVLERMARQGTTAALAIRQLGAGASMRDILARMRLINAGLMRMQALVTGVGLAWIGVTVVLSKAAMGPDPEEVKKQQAELTSSYTEALNDRYNEIRGFAGMFDEAMSNLVSPKTLQTNLQHQVDILTNWTRNMRTLASKGIGDDFITELQKMGPAASGEIAALTKMTDTELDKYVATWREKNALARQQANTELGKMKTETQSKISDLTKSLKPLGVAVDDLKETWSKAVKPFVEFFGQIASYAVRGVTAIGQFINKLNEISPWITKIGGLFLYLILTFTLLLAPIAVGIGLLGGMSAAFAATWAIVGPFAIGLAAVIGPAVGVAAAVIGIGAALILGYKYIMPFRDMVNAAVLAIKNFINGIIAQVQQFWAVNGPMIMQAVQNIVNFIVQVFNFLKPALTLLWQGVVFLIQGAWAAIKGVIQGAVTIILNIVKAFGALFTGNWSALWAAVKGILSGALQLVWNLVNLMFMSRILGPIRAGFGLIRTIVTGGWAAVKAIFASAVAGLKTFISALWSFTKGQFSAGLAAIKGFMSTLWSDITGVWTKIKGFLSGIDLMSIGKNIIQGLIDGIASMAGAVAAKVTEIGSNIKDTFTGLLGIHSPSRVFFEYGGFTGEGFALGLRNSLPDVSDMATRLAVTATDPMEQSYASSGSETLAPTYSRSSSSTATTFAPVVNVYVNGDGSGAGGRSIGEQVQQAIENQWRTFSRVNGPIVEG